MARGRSARSPLLTPAPPAGPRAGERAGSRRSGALGRILSELPSSRVAWCPAGETTGADGRTRACLSDQARRHEELVREAGSVVEASARRIAEPQIARLAAQLRALDAAEAAAGGPDPETEARRRRIMDHDITAARQRALLAALAAARPFGPPPGTRAVHRYAAESDPWACALVEEACRLLPRDWLARSRADSTIVPLAARLGADAARAVPAGWRGSYEHSAQTSVLRLGAGASPARGREYAVHELTHRMEALVPGLERIAWAYRERVREGEGGGAQTDGYAMRVYRDEGPEAVSELLAVGVQALAASPGRFARVLGDDAELRHLVLGALALT